ncbi:MAG: NADH-quinone oxidoreductase subunit M [bacterium]|nr:NADH-quinone oxidoreductase subunit M [bacterium]
MGDLGISFAERGSALLAWFSNPLTQMLLWPLIGCVLVAMTPKDKLGRIRFLAVLFCGLSFLSVVLMLTGLPEAIRAIPFFAQYQAFTPYAEVLQFWLPPEQYAWFAVRFGEAQSFTINWNVGIDGLNMPLVAFAATIMLLTCIWSLKRTERIREYFALFLLLQTGLLGIFVALDYVLFYLFWELMLIPMYFLIAGWGARREEAQRSAIKFFVYTVAGSVFYLIAFIALQIFSGRLDFSILGVGEMALRGGMDFLPFQWKLLIFIGLMLAFAVKIPMFPFHTWLPDAHTEAPTEMSVILAAVMLKTGAYGMIRIVYSTLPDIAYQAGPVIAACGVIAIVYGAAVTLVQTDLKRMIAYSSISHMGFIVLGISVMKLDGLVGSVFHMIGHGVIIAALFFLASVIEERYGTRDLRELAGMLRLAPAYGIALAIASFAAMGFPLMMGFWGELLILKGAFFNNPNWEQVRVGAMDGSTFLQWCAIVAIIGVLTSAVYIINMLTKVLTGEPGTAGLQNNGVGLQTREGEPKPWRGMQPLHAVAIVPLIAAMLLFFWWPAPIINCVQIPASGLYAIWLTK